MKYFELQGYKILVLCPKKISNNWLRYLKDRYSIFEADKFDYYVRYHTDLFGKRMNKEGMTLNNFNRFQKLLIVIDESHNLRNDASGRYRFLVEHFYRNPGTKDIKTLMLSATPINNKLTDIRNQFKLIVKGEDSGFREVEGIEIKSLERKFGDAQKYFNKWQYSENRRLSEIIQLDAFIKDLEHDVKALKELLDNLDEMNKVISLEIKEKPDENVIEKLKSLIIWWMKKKQGVEDEQLVNDIFDGGNLAMKKYKEGTPEERYHIENYDLITWFVISKNKNFL